MSDRFIRITGRINTILFFIVLGLSLLTIGGGCLLGYGINDIYQSTVENADPYNPGSGWLALGGIFGSTILGFVAAYIVAIGMIGIIADAVIFAPMFVSWIIWKKTGNKKVYQICGIIALSIIGLFVLMYIYLYIFSLLDISVSKGVINFSQNLLFINSP